MSGWESVAAAIWRPAQRTGSSPTRSGAIRARRCSIGINHCIAGILTGGAPDIGQRLGASWQFHETVLPMPAILADLEQNAETAALLETGGHTIR